jgi:nitroimidazol reductase NimA-like FMN-containing flavoprotein (pyridoxamine 5'-phosphate oxidase superfamily)
MNLLKSHESKPLNISSPKQRIYNFLKQNRVGVLATVDLDNNPHASAIYYAIDSTFVVSFLTKAKTKKHANLEHNNRAMLVVYEEKTQTTVQISGKASEITDSRQSHEIFRNTLRASLHKAESAVPPVSKLNAGEYIAYKLEPDEVTMVTYKQRSSIQPESLFESISFEH